MFQPATLAGDVGISLFLGGRLVRICYQTASAADVVVGLGKSMVIQHSRPSRTSLPAFVIHPRGGQSQHQHQRPKPFGSKSLPNVFPPTRKYQHQRPSFRLEAQCQHQHQRPRPFGSKSLPNAFPATRKYQHQRPGLRFKTWDLNPKP